MVRDNNIYCLSRVIWTRPCLSGIHRFYTESTVLHEIHRFYRHLRGRHTGQDGKHTSTGFVQDSADFPSSRAVTNFGVDQCVVM